MTKCLRRLRVVAARLRRTVRRWCRMLRAHHTGEDQGDYNYLSVAEVRQVHRNDDPAILAALCLGGILPGGEIAAAALLVEAGHNEAQHGLSQNSEWS